MTSRLALERSRERCRLQHFNRSTNPEDVFFVEGLADLAQRDETVVRASTSVAEKFSSFKRDTTLP